jgi:hypothetical protein
MTDSGGSGVADGSDRRAGAGRYTTGQLADELHVHVRTVQHWHRRGTIRPAWFTEDGELWWDVEDVRRQLDALHPERPSAPRLRRHGRSGLPYAGGLAEAPADPGESP